MPAHAQRMSSLLALDKERVPVNIQRMSVTLDVSKLSGWLNADADCRESKGGHTVRSEVYGPAGGRRRATAVQVSRKREIDCRLGAGHARSAPGTCRPWS